MSSDSCGFKKASKKALKTTFSCRSSSAPRLASAFAIIDLTIPNPSHSERSALSPPLPTSVPAKHVIDLTEEDDQEDIPLRIKRSRTVSPSSPPSPRTPESDSESDSEEDEEEEEEETVEVKTFVEGDRTPSTKLLTHDEAVSGGDLFHVLHKDKKWIFVANQENVDREKKNGVDYLCVIQHPELKTLWCVRDSVDVFSGDHFDGKLIYVVMDGVLDSCSIDL